MREERLGVLRGLAALSPDALSSIAYANQEIFLGLAVAGAAGLAFADEIALAIVGLLVLLGISYAQTLRTYPTGGGSYSVARENLGEKIGLVTAAALLVDYTLTVAVSLTAGVSALLSTFPALAPHRVALCLLLLFLITLLNLRGIRESGRWMSIPVGLFVLGGLVLVVGGLIRALTHGAAVYPVAIVAPSDQQAVSLALILHTFAAGCTALTGIEAIGNGVPLFKPPESRHASQAMALMVVAMGLLFISTVWLTEYLAILPNPGESILSALTRVVFNDSPLYYTIQISTVLVLLVAANTSFNGFPRLAYVLSQDGFLPRQLKLLGDRLVYSNGIILLSSIAGVLIVAFRADTHALIPLFAVGVFLAFTLSQAGMVVHWVRKRGAHWWIKAGINGLGTIGTALALSVIAYSKFLAGAWIVAVLIALIGVSFVKVRRHYQAFAAELSMAGLPPRLEPLPEPRVVVPVSSLNRVSLAALRYAQSISKHVTAVHVETDPEQTAALIQKWHRWGMDVDLEIVPSPYRSMVGPFLDFLDRYDETQNDGQLASVVIPEVVPTHWWEFFLHNQTAWIIKLVLLYRRRKFGKVRAIIDVPSHLRHKIKPR